MSRFNKEELAKMMSFIDRMDNHMTLNESKRYKKLKINEAVNGGKLSPMLRMQKISDPAKGFTNLYVGIAPLFKKDVVYIKTKYPQIDSMYANFDDDDKAYLQNGTVNKNNGQKLYNDAIIIKTKIVKGTKTNKTQVDGEIGDDEDIDFGFDLDESLVTSWKNPLSEAMFGFGDDDDDDDDEGNDDGLLDGLLDSENEIDFENGEVSSEKEMMDWFNNQYMTIIDELISLDQNRGIYDQSALARLKDMSFVYSQYENATEKSDRLDYERSDSDYINEICAALAGSSNYVNTISNVFKPLDLYKLMFGRIFSHKNRSRIQRLNPNAQHVLTGNQWTKWFGRKPKFGAPSYGYYSNNRGVLSHKDAEAKARAAGHDDGFDVGTLGSKAHEPIVGRDAYYYQGGYDYADTEPIDPNSQYFAMQRPEIQKKILALNGEDVLNTRPGVYNMGVGGPNNDGYNQKATDAYDAFQQAKANQEIADTPYDVDITTDYGKCKIYNEALLNYAESVGRDSKLKASIPISDPVSVFLGNVVLLSDELLGNTYPNPKDKQNIIAYVALSVALFCTFSKDQGISVAAAMGNQITENTQNFFKGKTGLGRVCVTMLKNIYTHMMDYIISKYSTGFNGGDDPMSNNKTPSTSSVQNGSNNDETNIMSESVFFNLLRRME